MANKYELTLGAIPNPGHGVSFRVWAPRAEDVSLVLLSEPGMVLPLEREADGYFSRVVPEAAPGMDYLYRIDGKTDRPDPASRHQPQGTRAPSRIVDLHSFHRTDSAWRGSALTDFIIYKLHIGTFTAEGTFEAAIAKLPYLRELGVTAIELMSIAAFPEGYRAGRAGVALFAPQSGYGGPQGLASFVEACHQNGLCCLLDVQYDHFNPEWNSLADFGPYLTERYWTPRGGAMNFDGPFSDGVRRFFVENAVYWLREYHLDALRIGSVQSLFDFSARHILDEIQAEFSSEAERLGRAAHLIAESDLNDLRILAPRERGGYALNAQSSGDFHHAVHALLTGDRRGCFVDFGLVADLAKALNQGFVYDGRYSTYRERRHGSSTAGSKGCSFVVHTEDPDCVALCAHGGRLGALATTEKQKLAACLLLLAPNIPLLFMGQEYGEVAPSLDTALDWSALDRPPHSQLLTLYRDLFALRREQPSLRGCRQDLCRAMFNETQRYLVVQRRDPSGSCTFALFNFSDAACRIPTPDLGGRFRLALASADARYGDAAGAQRVVAASEICPGWDLYAPCPAWGALVYVRGA